MCWAFWEVGTNDSKTRQLLVSSFLQSCWGARQGNQLSTVYCSVRNALNPATRESEKASQCQDSFPQPFLLFCRKIDFREWLAFYKNLKHFLSWVLFFFYSFTVMTLPTQYAPVMVFAFSQIQESWENLSESESYTQATIANIAAAIKISLITEWC